MHRSQHNSSRFSSVRSKNGPSPSLALSGARHGREREPGPSGLHRPPFTFRVSKPSSRFGKAPTLCSPQIHANAGAYMSLKPASITRCEELFTNYTISEDISGSVPEQQAGSRLVALEERSKLLQWRKGIKQDCKHRKEVFCRFQTVEDEADGLEEDQGTNPSGNPPSPHSNREWMDMATQEIESRPINKRMLFNTPPARSYPPFPRRDSIHEDARFEIPPERSLLDIDQLIAQSTSEEEIKELKQQKRLLRNRQAALVSRQRKSKRAEELEQEKKLLSERIIQLEDDLQSMRLQVEAAMHEKEQWQRQQLEAQHIIETLQWEKEEMVHNHTLETSELRRNISVLLKQI